MHEIYEMIPAALRSEIAVMIYMVTVVLLLIVVIILAIVAGKRGKHTSGIEGLAKTAGERSEALVKENSELRMKLDEEKARSKELSKKEVASVEYDELIAKAKELKVKLGEYPTINEIHKAVRAQEIRLNNLKRAREKNRKK